jgi:hypothetical protein
MELPMAKLDGTQELPNVVPASSTTAFPKEGLTSCPSGVNSGKSCPTDLIFKDALKSR